MALPEGSPLPLTISLSNALESSHIGHIDPEGHYDEISAEDSGDFGEALLDLQTPPILPERRIA